MASGLTGEFATLAQALEQRFDQLRELLGELEDLPTEPMCQDAQCPACQAQDLHDAYQRGAAHIQAWYESLPGVAKIREMAVQARQPVNIVQ